MTQPSPATIAAHNSAIAALTAATTTAELAEQLATWTRIGEPGVAPGVGLDDPDGRWFNGYHFMTKRGRELAATQTSELPVHTSELWAELAAEQRIASDRERLLAEDDAERRGPGQPPIGRPVPVRLPDWLIADLDRHAEQEGTSRARLIRDLIGEAMAARRARS